MPGTLVTMVAVGNCYRRSGRGCCCSGGHFHYRWDNWKSGGGFSRYWTPLHQPSDWWFLKADRTFSPEQKQAISDNLRGELPACFRIMAYGPAADSSEYGSQLEKVLIQAGWDSKGLLPFIVTGGEEPPTGITIMVDGLHGETVTIGRQLEAALRIAQVEDARFVIEKNLPDPMASTWVLLKVGRKGNQ